MRCEKLDVECRLCAVQPVAARRAVGQISRPLSRAAVILGEPGRLNCLFPSFWFGATQPAYKLPIPDKGPKHEVVHYEANRIDPDVRFTLEASKQLTGIPRAFLRQVLVGIVRQAKARGVTEVDAAFVAALNQKRG